MVDLKDLTVESFSPYVGNSFLVEGGEEAIELTLLKAQSYPDQMIGATLPDGSSLYKRIPFTLTFSGPLAPLLADATHTLRHAEIGIMEFYLKPFAQGEAASFYEAIFN